MFRRRRFWIVLIVLLVGFAVWRLRTGGPSIAPGSYLHLHLVGEYLEQPTDMIGKLFFASPRTLIDVLQTLHVAARDDRIAGLVLEVGPLEVGWGKAEDLRDALFGFKASGKPVYAVLEQEVASSNLEYFVASAADRLYLSPATTAPLTGLAAQYMFLGGVWEKIDVRMHVEKIAEYKTFGDMLVNREMSPAHREMANSLLDSMDGRFRTAIAESRKLTPEQVAAIIDAAPSSPDAFQRAGLADGARFVSDVRTKDAGDAKLVEMEVYEQVDLSAIGVVPEHSIAVVYGVGPIVMGESGRSAFGTAMGSETISEALDQAAENTQAKAIVFRVDSPGGSALASDLIWQATRRAREKKPVIVSMSDVAASGGYYISAGATKILAQPMTMTGSIGVVFARPEVSGLLARLGITTETLTRGRFARLNDLTAPFDIETRDKLLAEIRQIYSVFIDRVASGRELSMERVDEIGRGRVWTGAQAAENGLVDQTGGFIAAIAAAKEAAGIAAAEEVELLHFPRPRAFAERVAEALTSRLAAPRFPGEEQIRAAFAAFPFVGGGVLALMPEIIRVE